VNVKNEIPVTECWRESYEQFAAQNQLESFPTRALLKANPGKSQKFCHWLRYMLSMRHQVKICNANPAVCSGCQSRGLSKWAAMYVLAHIVRDEDAELYATLQDKCKQHQGGDDPNYPPPQNSPSPLAKAMPVPQPMVVTEAVARELTNKPWVKKYF